MVLSDHTVYNILIWHEGARHSLKTTLSVNCILCIFINSLVVIIIHLYIETQREVQFLPVKFIYILNIVFSKFLCLNGVFHHFLSNL